MKRIAVWFAAIGAAVLTAAPSGAAPSRAELDARLQIAESRVADQEERVGKLEQRVLTGDPAAVRLQQQMDALTASLTRMTGELERLQFENNQLRSDVSALRRELELVDPNFSASSSSASPASSAAPGSDATGGGWRDATPPVSAPGTLGSTVAVTIPQDDPRAAFQLAQDFLLGGRYDEAEQAFGQFTALYPDADKVGEALFWHAETNFIRGRYGAARDLYVRSLQEDPSGVRAPDAMVKLAAALTSMEQPAQACVTLNAFPRQYPSASAALRSKADRERQRANCG